MSLQNIIETALENRADINPPTVIPGVKEVVLETIRQFDSGKLCIAKRPGVGEWKINEWTKKVVLPSFRIQDNETLNDGVNKYFNKMPAKFTDWSKDGFRAAGFRTVPGAVARHGSFATRNVVLMPSYANIGAYVDENAMVDTWTTADSCAQIDRNIHLGGGVGIDGVLEPLQTSPTIIEDNCFIGACPEIVEGVIVEGGSVTSVGTFIRQSIKILGRTIGGIYQGYVPAGLAVVSGNMPSKDGDHSLYCAVIIKCADAQTHAKTSVNELLRGI